MVGLAYVRLVYEKKVTEKVPEWWIKKVHQVFMQLGKCKIAALAIRYGNLKKFIWWVEKNIIKMFSLKFDQRKIISKDFHKNRQETNILTIDINEVVVSGRVSYSNGKDCRSIEGYQVYRQTIIPIFIKKSKSIFSYGVSQYVKSSIYTISFNVSEALEWVLYYQKIWNEVESQLYDKLITGPIKWEGKDMHVKLKTWKERIRTKLHGQAIVYDIYCNTIAVLKIDSVHKIF